jgi:hypothetical protein
MQDAVCDHIFLLLLLDVHSSCFSPLPPPHHCQGAAVAAEDDSVESHKAAMCHPLSSLGGEAMTMGLWNDE